MYVVYVVHVTPFKMIYMGEHCFTGPTRPRIIHRQAFLLQHTGIQTVLLYKNNASLNGKVTFLHTKILASDVKQAEFYTFYLFYIKAIYTRICLF